MTLTPDPMAERLTLGARYRAWYERLPVGVQMIGMQVWLPVVFTVAFVFCYVAAFHAPAYHGIPVAVVGPAGSVRALAAGLAASSKGMITTVVVPSVAAAREAVRAGTYTAAFVPGQGSGQLIVASANSFQLSNAAQQFFGPVAAASHLKLAVTDLAPLPPWDSFGTSLFYLALVPTIGGYMVSMFVGMMGAGLKHWQRFSIIAAASLLLPLVSALLARYVIGAIHGHFLMVWLIGAATSFAVGCLVNGLAYFAGRFVTGLALIIFVFLNIPSSGGAYAPQLVPQPFRWLHTYVAGTGSVNLLRHAVYGVAPAPWHGWLLLGCYAVVGVVLALVGKPFYTRRMRRRFQAGKPPTMMMSAQIAALVHAGYVIRKPADDAVGVPAVGAAEAPGTEVAETEVREAAADPVPGPAGVPVYGRVTAEDGSGVGRAALTLADNRGQQFDLGESGADGGYRLSAPEDGSYLLIVSAEGREPAVRPVTVRSSESGVGIRLDVTLPWDGADRAPEPSPRLSELIRADAPGNALAFTD